MGLLKLIKKLLGNTDADAAANNSSSSAQGDRSQLELSINVRWEIPERMSEEEYMAMRQKNIEYLEDQYDFSTVEGIQSIPGPSEEFKAEELKRDFTGRIEYYLLSKAEHYIKLNQPELAIACFRKAMDHMPMYGDFYPRKQYMRLPRYLRKLRRFDEARAEESRIQELFHGDYQYLNEPYWPTKRKNDLLEMLRISNTDLVVAAYMRCCCADCAKYRGRVYSYYGRDMRFPRFPAFLLDQQHNCGISYNSFYLGLSSLGTATDSVQLEDEVIRRSNRAFIDDRTPDEVADFLQIEQLREREKMKESARADYDWLWEYMPEMCPKSFSAYMRIKNANSEKYRAIVDAAKEQGRSLI